MQTLTKLIRMILDDIKNGEQNLNYDIELDHLKIDIQHLITEPVELRYLILTEFRLQYLGREEILELFARLGSIRIEVDQLGKLSAISLLDICNAVGVRSSQEILRVILRPENRLVWRLKYLLSDFLSMYRLENEFALEWFIGIHELVKNDLMNADIYKAIANQAFTFPDAGEKIVRSYMAMTTDKGLKQIAWMALGAIRVASLRNDQRYEMAELDTLLKSSANIEFRELYILSWVTTYQKGSVEVGEIIKIIKEVGDGSDAESTAKSFLIFQVLASRTEYADQEMQLLNELDKIVELTHTDEVKYWSLMLLERLQNKERLTDIGTLLLSIFTKILPIDIEKKFLWQLIETFLMECKNCNNPLLQEYYELLLKFAPKELCEILAHHDFEFLGHQIVENFKDGLLKSMLFSDQSESRKLILTLVHHYNLSFQNLQSFSPHPSVLEDLLSDIVNDHLSEKISDLLIAIEPLFETATPKLKKDFIDLMIYQGMNLPGACYKRWKELAPKSEKLEMICSNLEYYFSRFEETMSLYPAKFEFYPFSNAAQQKQKMLAREITSGVKEKSIIAKLADSTTILYSKQYTFFDSEGKLKNSVMKPLQHEFELPRLEFMDPEGAVKFRMSFVKHINQQ